MYIGYNENGKMEMKLRNIAWYKQLQYNKQQNIIKTFKMHCNCDMIQALSSLKNIPVMKDLLNMLRLHKFNVRVMTFSYVNEHDLRLYVKLHNLVLCRN